jgi:hypothetical protein
MRKAGAGSKCWFHIYHTQYTQAVMILIVLLQSLPGQRNSELTATELRIALPEHNDAPLLSRVKPRSRKVGVVSQVLFVKVAY